MIEELAADVGRQIRFRVVQERSDVVMKRAFSSALIVDEEGLRVPEHDVARLEIPIKKVAAVRAQQKVREPREVILESLLVERNSCQTQEIIFEVIQVPCNRLPVEAVARIADAVIEIASGLDLK